MRGEPIRPVIRIAALVRESFRFVFRAHGFLPKDDFGQ